MASKKITPEKAIAYMTEHLEDYERHLLGALIRRPDIYTKYNKNICKDARTPGVYYNDFENPHHYNFYRLILAHREAFDDLEMPTEDYLRLAKQLLDMMPGKTVVDDEIMPDMLALLKELKSPEFITDSDIDMLIEPAITTWNANKRLRSQLINLQRVGVTTDIFKRVDDMQDTKDMILAGSVNNLVEDLELPDPDEPVVDRIHLSSKLHYFNSNLGGGLGRKEHVLFAALTGQGKTVMACQLAADVAMQQKHVIFISTEQPKEELQPRIYSCISTLPGFTPTNKRDIERGYRKNCSVAQQATIEKIHSIVSPYLHFSCWVGDNSSLSVSDIDGIVANSIKRFGDVALVILDWIGGSLDGHTIDGGEKRQLYLDAAHKMKQIAYKHNVACFSLVQTSADAADKQFIEQKHLGECKSLHHECVAAFGVSALKNKNGNSDEVYSNTQWMNCFKSRNAVGTACKVTRDFDHSQFLPYT